jgi:hypothetical protein
MVISTQAVGSEVKCKEMGGRKAEENNNSTNVHERVGKLL